MPEAPDAAIPSGSHYFSRFAGALRADSHSLTNPKWAVIAPSTVRRLQYSITGANFRNTPPVLNGRTRRSRFTRSSRCEHVPVLESNVQNLGFSNVSLTTGRIRRGSDCDMVVPQCARRREPIRGTGDRQCPTGTGRTVRVRLPLDDCLGTWEIDFVKCDVEGTSQRHSRQRDLAHSPAAWLIEGGRPRTIPIRRPPGWSSNEAVRIPAVQPGRRPGDRGVG